MFIRNHMFFGPMFFDSRYDQDISDELRYDIFPEGFIPAGFRIGKRKRKR